MQKNCRQIEDAQRASFFVGILILIVLIYTLRHLSVPPYFDGEKLFYSFQQPRAKLNLATTKNGKKL